MTETDRWPAWRPISTAPRDGTEFIGRDRGGLVAISWAEDPKARRQRWVGPGGHGDWFPTHWLPLPQAPDAADG